MMKYSLILALLLGPAAGLLFADKPSAEPVKVPFDLLITKHMVVNIKINGKGPYRVIFDTGAPISLLSTKAAKAAGVIDKNGGNSAFSLFGPVSQNEIKSFELGDLKAKAVPVVVMDHPTVKIISEILGPIEGIIGFPFFARYKMTLDYKAKEMTFVPNGFVPTDVIQAMMNAVMSAQNPTPKYVGPTGMWGILLEKKDGDDEFGVTIKEVLAGSAAAKAGLQSGDRLLTLDDRWTDTLTDCYLAASFVKAGTEVEVAVKRNGKDMTVMVKPLAGL
jgi:membrane-associated protease RseP (regulator of RpoE activity)